MLKERKHPFFGRIFASIQMFCPSVEVTGSFGSSVKTPLVAGIISYELAGLTLQRFGLILAAKDCVCTIASPTATTTGFTIPLSSLSRQSVET